MGVTLFILGQLMGFAPTVFFETEWYAVSAVLCLCGLLVRRRSYRIGALCLVVICIAFSISGYQRVVKYRVWHSKQPSWEERKRQSEEQLQMLGKTNAETSRTVK